jgi:hypothetical protein
VDKTQYIAGCFPAAAVSPPLLHHQAQTCGKAEHFLTIRSAPAACGAHCSLPGATLCCAAPCASQTHLERCWGADRRHERRPLARPQLEVSWAGLCWQRHAGGHDRVELVEGVHNTTGPRVGLDDFDGRVCLPADLPLADL